MPAAAEPFLKWAGGKGQLLDTFANTVPRRVAGYHEPFVGGGALFFYLHRRGVIGGDAHLSDVNPTLVDTYRAIRDDVDAVIEHLRSLDAAHDAEDPGPAYYAARDRFNELLGAQTPERAALMVYLNRVGFNGLYRENAAGLFNVPVGTYKNPSIVREATLRATSGALQGVSIEQRHFDEGIRERAQPGDLVYFDPPYEPLSTTSSFTAYAKGGFGADDQRRLAALFEDLTRADIRCMLSNSTAPLILEIYEDMAARIPSVTVNKEIAARRNINSKAENRGEIFEVLVLNFPPGTPDPRRRV